MDAGRELDALVAEKVMGWVFISDSLQRFNWRTATGALLFSDELPHYSTDIAAAWQVVETISTRFGDDGELHLVRWGKYWNAAFDPTVVERDMWDEPLDDPWYIVTHHHGYKAAHAFTAPHAICLAALNAVGHPVNQEPR